MISMQKKKSGKLRDQMNKYYINNAQVSFNSLSKSKSKQKNIFQSQIGFTKSPKSGMIYSQRRKRIETVNKENAKDQYQLFTNLIKSRKQSKHSQIVREHENENQSILKRKNHFVHYNQEYSGQSQLQKTPQRKRSTSKNSVEKYFEGASSLIRKKNSQQSQIKQHPSTQTSLDPVNKSEDSIQFDMSPYIK